MNKTTPLRTKLIGVFLSVISVIFLSNLVFLPVHAQTVTFRTITFPVIGNVSYYDDFGAPRVGHTHEGNDLMGHKMMPLVAAVTGTVRQVIWPEATWGYSVTIEDADGYTYHYLHINNDTPGTDDDLGGGMNAYAPDIRPGDKVVAGQQIGWMGDSGNAETTTAHLHFEIRYGGIAFSPYASLKAATHITTPVEHPVVPGEILPYGQFTGGASIAAGNFDADSDSEIVTGAGPGGGAHVEVFDQGNPIPKASFIAYDNFTGGVDVAAGDVDGDGVDEIITAPGKGRAPEVKVFKLDGTRILTITAYAAGFRGGVKVTAADLTKDGKAEIITAPASGGGAHVKVFEPTGGLLSEFMAYDGFTGGIDVAAYKAFGSELGGIVTAPSTGGGPHVKVFDLVGVLKSQFMAYDEVHRGGVRVSVGTIQGSTTPQIITAPLLGGPDFRMFDLNGVKLSSDSEFEVWWSGNWDVAAGMGKAFVSSGPNTMRRASVRTLDFRSTNTPSSGDSYNGDNFNYDRSWRYRGN